MNKITIIKECIKAYNRENTVRANVCIVNPIDYNDIKNIDGTPLYIDNVFVFGWHQQQKDEISIYYDSRLNKAPKLPELILN